VGAVGEKRAINVEPRSLMGPERKVWRLGNGPLEVDGDDDRGRLRLIVLSIHSNFCY
jgi:hypothetical protein